MSADRQTNTVTVLGTHDMLLIKLWELRKPGDNIRVAGQEGTYEQHGRGAKLFKFDAVQQTAGQDDHAQQKKRKLSKAECIAKEGLGHTQKQDDWRKFHQKLGQRNKVTIRQDVP